MKKLDWLMLFGWPALTVIILLLLLASPLLLSDKRPPPTGPLAAAANVKYTLRNGKGPIMSEEIAEIRALYAPDLFASARGGSLPAALSATNRSDPGNIIPSENPLFLSFPPATNETSAPRPLLTGRNVDDYGDEPGFPFHPPRQSSPRTRQPAGNLARLGDSPLRSAMAKHGALRRSQAAAVRHPKLSFELKGELKHLSIEPDIFRDIALPAGRKFWSVQAQVRINGEGRVEHVLAESTDCAPAIYQEIVRRLYQCRLTNVTQACEGIIIISYPAYSMEHPEKH